MSFPRYPKYKPSGVEWLGDVPEHWEVTRLKNLFSLMKRLPEDQDDIVTAFRDGEVTLRSNRRIDGFTNAIHEHGYQRILRGDLVIHAMDAFAGAIGVSDSTGKSTPVYSVCAPRYKGINTYYYGRLLRHMALSGYINSLAKGIRERSTEFRWSESSNVLVSLPPPTEQTAIATFLDRETSKIDALVGEQQRLIELLKEKRQAVISHAVSKGLNPNAPMKPSGIQWLGDVPEHWELGRIKSLSSFVTSGPRGWSERIGETGALFIQSGDLNDQLEVEFATAKRVQVDNDAESVRTRLHEGDVVVCVTGAKTGNVAVCENIPHDAYVNQHVCLVRPNSEILPMFLGLVLKSKLGQSYFEVSQYGLKQGLSLENINEAPVTLPDMDEQRKIISYIDIETAKLAALTAQAEQAIELLQERRTALISAAVTGKIDVREEINAETIS